MTKPAFALEHAKQHNLERIIYAIPFTPVIDQTAFARFSAANSFCEHHASIDESRIEGREARAKLRLAMEDWAAPVRRRGFSAAGHAAKAGSADSSPGNSRRGSRRAARTASLSVR